MKNSYIFTTITIYVDDTKLKIIKHTYTEYNKIVI
jgi:hypothetical protein